MRLLLLSQLFKRIIDRGALKFVDSLLGGAAGFGSSIPSYGDIGAGYSGDFFGGGSAGGGGGIGSTLLEGLGRGILGGLTGGLTGGSNPASYGSPRQGPHTNQTQNDMQSLLALAMRSFETPRSLV